MAESFEHGDVLSPGVAAAIQISSGSDEDFTDFSSVNGTEKQQWPFSIRTPKPSIISQAIISKKKKSGNSGKRKVKRIPCLVCCGRFGTQVSLDLHMKVHWKVFSKMEALHENLKHKIKVKELMNGECKCSRCIYEWRDNEKPYEITKNFICQVCNSSFFTANKLSKHMDKHRESYYKMKKLEEETPLLFFNCPIINGEY